MESRADFREREGLILSQCRLESGLSQEYVARQMDVNIRTVRNWEEGLSPIRNDDLLMWFTVCKQSPPGAGCSASGCRLHLAIPILQTGRTSR